MDGVDAVDVGGDPVSAQMFDRRDGIRNAVDEEEGRLALRVALWVRRVELVGGVVPSLLDRRRVGAVAEIVGLDLRLELSVAKRRGSGTTGARGVKVVQ
jgi:hypothetical protein